MFRKIVQKLDGGTTGPTTLEGPLGKRIANAKDLIALPYEGFKRISGVMHEKFSEKVLGAGNFGKVFMASSVADPDFKVAIKTL